MPDPHTYWENHPLKPSGLTRIVFYGKKEKRINYFYICTVFEHNAMELKFLGTSAATPTQDRNLPAIALRLNNGELLLFDAGEDVQRRFETAKLRFNVPTTILISHMHGDHVIGLPGLLFNFHMGGRTAPLSIYGPPGIATYLLAHYQTIGLIAKNYPLTVGEIHPSITNESKKTALSAKQSRSSFKLVKYTYFLTEKFERTFVDLDSNIILVTDAFQISVAWVEHSVMSLGFRFDEAPLDGKFNPDRAKELKIPMGSLWRRMQHGATVNLKDGRVIDPIATGIVTPKRPGYTIVYSGDSAPCEGLRVLAQNSDYFLCESTYSATEKALAQEKSHMTSEMAAEIARECQVKTLVLCHFSTRYNDLSSLLEEAQKIFPNTLIATDLYTIELKPKENFIEEKREKGSKMN